MTKPIYRLSSIMRPLEPQYPTNRAVLILLPLIGLGLGGAAVFLHDAGLADAASTGLSGLLAAFLVWALGREVDPDRNEAAFIAMALTVIAIALGWAPALWVLTLALMATRVVVRTVGQAAKLTDLAIVTVLAGLAVFVDGYWAMGVVAGFAMAVDLLHDRKRTLNLVFAAFATGFSMFAVVQRGGDWGALIVQPLGTIDPGWSLAALILTVLSFVFILTCPPVTSVCDANSEPLERRRVRDGAIIVVLFATAAMFEGQAGLLATLPIWAVLAGLIGGRAWPKRKPA
ncbi:hypothetical protein [uncultured Maricaulis sp.]|uniref:hypothetical protein n=1 Tax=uncultured Maricaulis sp. TaxID=174710 RepID=UPI0030DD7C66